MCAFMGAHMLYGSTIALRYLLLGRGPTTTMTIHSIIILMVIRSYVSSTALATCTMLGLSVTGVNWRKT